MTSVINYIIGFIIIVIMIVIYIPKQLIIDHSVYIQILTLLIFLTGSIITMISFKNNLEDRYKMIGINYSNLTQSKIHEIDKMFMNNNLLDRLYLEMYKDDPNIVLLKKYKPEMSYPMYSILKAEHHACNIIFQSIADIYMCELCVDINSKKCKEWINTFSGWLKSPILKKHWKYLKREHDNNVVTFINDIINL